MQRAVAALAALLLLAAGAAAAPAAPADACGVDCSSTFVPALFGACLLGVNANATVLPSIDVAAWDQARRTFNYRTLRSPAAIFYAQSTEEVAAVVKCAHDWGVAVSPAAGRQGFQGLSVPDGALVVDVTALTNTSLSQDGNTFTVGAGNSNVMTVSALHATNTTGAAVPTGVCSFVGTAGFVLGGGFGLLGRYAGLACDSLVGLEMVLANGTVVKANKTHHSDLLWASCGGGGGTLGIATSFDFNVTRLPNDGRLTYLSIGYAGGVPSTVASFKTFQDALPALDRRFGFTYDISLGARLGLTGLFLGEPAEALQLLRAAGLLERLDSEPVATPDTSDVATNVSAGFLLKGFPSFYEMAAEQSVPFWTPPSITPWGPFSNYTPSAANVAWTKKVMAGEPRVVGGPLYNVWHYSQSRLSAALPDAGIQALAQPRAGRRVGDPAADATAFPHRDKLFVLDAVVAVPSETADAAASSFETVSTLAEPANVVNSFLSTIKPHLGASEAAYANYQPNALANFEAAFWGGNAARLAAIKAAYDTLGTFNKPYTVSGAAAPAAAALAPDAPAPAPVPPPTGAATPGARAGTLVATAVAASVLALLLF
ncbi:FAD-linked oxidase [Micractinium conductrix]|uniref:FAD-linked oxidase n=1 Tax=Micractinium conductrix TaxID=554055 RepID=A0A2P6V431_9CHLO|nr:FAD-linked oxidase [Micractinium conductrix]|eukprot:PSC68846.1 FAD-linked oxidase [Micractinium conductrix]